MVALKTHVEDPDVGTRFVVWIGRHTPTADPLSGITTRKTRAAAKAKAEQQIPPLRWNSRSSAALRNDNKRSATARAHATISGDGLKVQVWAWAAVG
jgi:hypothetical protein